jgi:hypothetical protein
VEYLAVSVFVECTRARMLRHHLLGRFVVVKNFALCHLPWPKRDMAVVLQWLKPWCPWNCDEMECALCPQKAQVLVVDEDRDAREAMTELLQIESFDVIAARQWPGSIRVAEVRKSVRRAVGLDDAGDKRL